MHDAHAFLTALAVVLGVAGATTVVCQRLHQPVVIGYVLAGLLVGPHVPSGLVADAGVVQSLSELGVILLMFSLGLEFHISRIARIGATAGLTSLIECSAMFFLGFTVAELLGWSPRESLFAGAVVTISSTTVIVKAFEEHPVRPALRERVFGILIFEDLIAIGLLALLPAAAASGLEWQGVLALVGRLGATLAVLFVAGLLVVPRAIRSVTRIGRPETTLVASLGLCFAGALGAQALGYSVALGAFVAGALVAESGEAGKIEALVQPVRDLFAAIFFVSVGMLIDPSLVAENAGAIVALALVVVAGKLATVASGVFLTGGGTRTAIETGMSLAQIGEFSFIIASLGQAIGATGSFLYPVAVAVSVLTMTTTPFLIRAAPRVAAGADAKLPHRVQTLAVLYGSWIDRIRGAAGDRSVARPIRRLLSLLALDALLLAAVAIGVSLRGASLAARLVGLAGLDERIARAIVGAGALALALPLVFGIVRVSRRVGVELARHALPDARSGALDLSLAPRRALVVTLQLGTILMVELPLLALVAPFISAKLGIGLLFLSTLALALALWRRASDLQGHVRAGAGALIEALASQRRSIRPPPEEVTRAVEGLAAGLGEPEAFLVEADGAACSRTLSELNLRGRTGATVLAITRAGRTIVYPGAHERLEVDDLLALAGSHDAVAAAKTLLARGDLAEDADADGA
ncbi:MAG: cation:proton antiporter [Myxococcota bacterium]